MDIHENARLTPIGRERLTRAVASGQTPEAAARAAGVCPRTARKWVARFKAEGVAGLADRSSRPHRLNRPTPAAIVEAPGDDAPAQVDIEAVWRAESGHVLATLIRLLRSFDLGEEARCTTPSRPPPSSGRAGAKPACR